MTLYRSNNEVEARPVPQDKDSLEEYLEWAGKGVYDCGFGNVCVKIPNGEIRFGPGEWLAKNSAGDVRAIGQAELVTLAEGKYTGGSKEVANVAGPEAEAVKDKEIPGARTAAENIAESRLQHARDTAASDAKASTKDREPEEKDTTPTTQRVTASTGEARPASRSEPTARPAPTEKPKSKP